MSAASTDPVEPINIPLICGCCPSIPCGQFLTREINAWDAVIPDTCIEWPSGSGHVKLGEAVKSILPEFIGWKIGDVPTPSATINIYDSSSCGTIDFTEIESMGIICDPETIFPGFGPASFLYFSGFTLEASYKFRHIANRSLPDMMYFSDGNSRIRLYFD